LRPAPSSPPASWRRRSEHVAAAGLELSALRYRLLDASLARGLLPDPLLRAGSRYGARARERRELRGGIEAREQRLRELVARMSSGPIAEVPEKANEQHYELPPEFFELMLGPRRKYSGCLWEPATCTLAQAEEAMLALSCERAGIRDGMRILDLGCGWGALSLWLAESYPRASVLGVSNSSAQRRWIEAERDRLRLRNLEVLTADVNELDPGGGFDRVVSVEMFEHMRNWRELLRRIAGWLGPDGRLFVHVFSHRAQPYRFEGTWAAERFFTAGLMPSHELISFFQEDMLLRERWAVDGTHYARTLRAWLARLDAAGEQAVEILTAPAAGKGAEGSRREARALLARWRLFLISTAEIWARDLGNSWIVSHYLMEPRGGRGMNPEVRRTYSA
jgi:cyclopropane-fatty-acyl-phospholipid synthase